MPYDEKITKILLENARCKREYFLNIVSVILTLGINILLIYASYHLANTPEIAETISNFLGINYEFIAFLSTFNSYAIIVLLICIFVFICFYNASYQIRSGLKNFSIDIMPEKKCNDLFENYCKLLNIKKPILFFNDNVYDSSIFGVKIRGKKAIGVPSRVYFNIVRLNDYHSFNYQVTSTLGSIYLGHYDLLFQLFTFWARIIPFYNRLYSRTLSYSTDRVAQILIGTYPLITSILRETSGMDFITDESAKEIVSSDFAMTKFEKSVSIIYGLKNEYPLPYFRITRILDNEEKDKEFINNLNNETLS